MSAPARRLRIGYAFSPKKVVSFMQPSLVDLAKERGIDLVPIDSAKPLIEQGPFDCIIHKLYVEEWRTQLEEFSSKNRSVAVIDLPDAIDRIRNRIAMLEAVNELKMAQGHDTLGVPKQIVIYDSESLSDSTVLEGLKFPVIAKPLAVDGSATSHKLSLVFNNGGLKGLKPPIALQEFVNHGGVIFKVYVVGKYVKCVTRRSLADISEDKLTTLESILSFSQISNLTGQDRSDESDEMLVEESEMPPLNFVNEIANGLRQALGLHLFNFDMIRDNRVGNRYLVIDINYFPGYANMPSYETVLTDFFWDIFHQKQIETNVEESGGSGSEQSSTQ